MNVLLKRLAQIAAAALALAALVFAGGQLGLLSGTRPAGLGLDHGRLKAVPSTPNAVSSQATDAPHAIAPLTYPGDGAAAFAQLKRIVERTPRTRIITDRPDYLYAEFRSKWLGFVDDVEFHLDARAHVIHVRSASRLGRSDLGVNRARIESLRAELARSGA